MSRKEKVAPASRRDYIGAITAAQEEKRLRLARDPHDDTIQARIAFKQHLQLSTKRCTTPQRTAC